MELRVGETVRMLHDNMEGVVQSIEGNTITVLVDDFLDIEVSKSDIVQIDQSEQKVAPRVSESRESARTTADYSSYTVPFVAIHKTQEAEWELWLVNTKKHPIYFNTLYRINKSWRKMNNFELGAEKTHLMGRFSHNDFYDMKECGIQMFNTEPEGRELPELKTFRFKPATTYLKQKTKTIYEIKREAVVYLLEETPLEIASMPSAPKLSQRDKKRQGLREHDLHIEQLAVNVESLEAHQILAIQLEEFEQLLNKAIVENAEKVIFIHGKGSGKLKEEIKKRLADNQFVKKHMPANIFKYDNGAIEVTL